jgi:parvulin-like peptidyl-prolyl isomerase
MRAQMRNTLFALLLLAAGACDQGKSKLDDPPGSKIGSGGSGGSATSPKGGPAIDIDSKDILNRKEAAAEVQVKHVLIGWKELDEVYQGRLDPRAQKRTNADAAKLAKELADKLRKNPDQIDALIKEHSEDPGSLTGEPYPVKADAPFVPEFKALALHLKDKEVGIVKTKFGYHVMVRVPPPPPDPLESADILKREPDKGTVYVQHVVIGWKDLPAVKSGRGGSEKAKTREKAEADTIAKDVLARIQKGEDMAKLMKEFSEDPGSKDTGKSYPISSEAQMGGFEAFKNLSLRLKAGEAGLVKSPLGWHVTKRVAPPPPDPLESADILKREPQGQKVKVKHILLGWKDVNTGGDERAKKRERPALEKLVKDTVAKLKKGTKIEPLMKELSEDPGSANSGEGYDVTPDAGFVEPFKNLSLRLKPSEVGVVKTDFGIHIIQRVE